GTAMIPTAIDAALRSKSVAKGDLVLALACGAGISFGAMVYRV
ncbi:ketoacyl-ACP synthase III, partial [bacterium]|nr:ketoacyl-ACP synthase III [bacterium]